MTSSDRAGSAVAVLGVRHARVRAARDLARRRHRDAERRFLAEGWKALAAVREVDPELVIEVFATASAAEEHVDLLTGLSTHLVDDRAMAALADAVTPQGLVAVCRHLDVSLDDLLADEPAGRSVVVCVDVRDPGNAGTIIRTADAVGARSVVLTGESVDPYNPKTVRATVGSLFHVPLVRDPDIGSVVDRLRSAGYRILAADGAAAIDLFEAADTGRLDGPVAWLFGNEAHGLTDSVADLADERIAIPILGRAESLNLATAAAVCLYATAAVHGPARQRSAARSTAGAGAPSSGATP